MRLHRLSAVESKPEAELPLPDSGPETRFDLPDPGPALGALLAEQGALDAQRIDAVLAHQRTSGLRFGEAAVALGHASAADVQRALARQFRYPLASPAPGTSVGHQAATGPSPELVMLHQPFGARAEMLRTLRTQITLRVEGMATPPRALALVSAGRGDGRSWAAANLAVALAQLGGRALLVDADLRHGRQHELFGLPARRGLADMLAGRADATAVQPVPAVPGLAVLPVGAPPPNPLELVERRLFGALLQHLARSYTHIVVDTPAASVGADAMVIAARCGAAALLTRRDAGRMAGLQRLAQALAGTGAAALGVIYNAQG